MSGNIKKIITMLLIAAMPLVISCSHKPAPVVITAQSLDFNLDTASGSPLVIDSPAALIANPEATQIALQCEDRANNVKQSGVNDAAAQDAYYNCLQSAFNLAQ